MGLNLGKLGQDFTGLLGDAGNAIGGAVGAVAHEATQLPGQIEQAAAPMATNIGIGAQGTGQLLGPTVQLGKGIVQGALQAIPAAGDFGSILAGSATGNKAAVTSAAQRLTKTLVPFAQFVPHEAAVAATTLDPSLPGNFTPKPGLQQDVLGSAPVQSLENTYSTARNQGASMPSAIGQTVASGLAVGLAAAGAKSGIDGIHEGAMKTGSVLNDLASQPNPLANESGHVSIAPIRDSEGKFSTTPGQKATDVPVSSLTSYEGAPNVGAVEGYKAMLREGKTPDPIIVKKDSQGNYGVEEGKHRLAAYQQMGLKTIPATGDIPPSAIPTVLPSEATVMTNYVDNVRGMNPLNPADKATLKTRAQSIADRYGIGKSVDTPANRAKAFTQVIDANIQKDPTFLQKIMAPLQGEGGYVRLPGKGESDSMAEALGTTPEQLQATQKGIENNPNVNPEVRSDSMKQILNVAHIKDGTDARQREAEANDIIAGNKAAGDKAIAQMSRQDFEHSPANQTINKPGFDIQPGDDKGAIAQATGNMAEWQSLYDNAARRAQGLSGADKAKLSDAINGEDVGKVDKPNLFREVVDRYRNANDYDLALRRLAGGKTQRFNNGRFSHTFYNADPATMDALGIPKEEQYDLNGKPTFDGTGAPLNGDYRTSHDLPRQYQSEKQAAESSGGILRPAFKNAIESEKHYTQTARTGLQGNLLREALRQSSPEEVADLGYGRDANGKAFTQAAGKLPFNSSDRLQGVLRNFKSAWEPKSTVGKVAFKTAEKTNALTKKSLWFGSAFHYGNETSSFLGSNLFHPIVAAKGLTRAVESLASNDGWQGVLQRARTNKVGGTTVLEGARAMGVDLPENSRLNRVSSAFSLTQAEAAMKDGIDPHSPEGVKAGGVINRIAGQKNDAVEGSDPTIQKFISAGAAAPRWTPSQLRLVSDAFTKPGMGRFTEGGGARNAIIGKRALEAGIGIGGSALIAGKLPTAQQALNQAGLTLNNPVPNIQLKSKNSKGESQEMVLPTDAPGLALGLATNAPHFLQSRESPALSFATKVATNQNWNGEPLADPTKPNYAVNLVKNAALNSVEPIGVQNFTNLQNNPNNPSITQGLAQEIGGRLKTNPNDPQALSATQYYGALGKYVTGNNSLNTTDKAAAVAYVTKDKTATGQTIELNQGQSQTVWKGLATNPNSLAAVQKFYQATNNHDPEWSLSGNGTINNQAVPKILLYAVYKSLPNGDLQKDIIAQANPWIGQTETASANWGAQQTFSGNTVNGPGYIAPPNPSPQVQAMMNQVSQLSAIPEANRTPEQISQLSSLENNPDLQTAYQNQDQYTNQVRAQENLPEINYAGNTPPAVQDFMTAYDAASTADRATMRTASPGLYNAMQGAMEQEQLAGIEKQGGEAYYGGGVGSPFLGDISGVGNYDITSSPNANGTNNYALTNFTGTGSVNGLPGVSLAQSKTRKSPGNTASNALANYFTKLGFEELGKTLKSKGEKPYRGEKYIHIRGVGEHPIKRASVSPVAMKLPTVGMKSQVKNKPKVALKKALV